MSTYSWQNFVLVEWQQLQEKIVIADNLIVASIRIDDIKKPEKLCFSGFS
ncbi:MAG: hypothetical protein QM289_04490 [Bacillota bacterium]|jgi:hypothetical protein|nr:hypothetical protein [Bacillota bacterium]